MRAIDLFAGCGGASLGLQDAGIEVVAHYERDPYACATLRAWGAAGVHEADLADIDPASLPAVDLWRASPPCQPFSAAGLQLGAADARDGYPALLRLLDEGTPPAWLVIENVRGLTFRRFAAYWSDVQRRLRVHFGRVEWSLLDAASFGVPQHRRRVITVCGPQPIAWPAPTHGPGLLPYVSMGAALGLDVALRPERGAGCAARHGARRDHPPDEPAPTIAGAGKKQCGPRFILSSPALPVSATEYKGCSSDPEKRCRASDSLALATDRRRLTWQECTILQDLARLIPHLQGAKTAKYRQIGNACPPKLVEAVIRCVAAAQAQRAAKSCKWE